MVPISYLMCTSLFIQMPNLQYPEVTIGALLYKKDKILLLKSHKWNDKYILPCGHIEFGESATDAVKREVKEETNLKVEDIEFLHIEELINSNEFQDTKRHFVCLQFSCRAKSREVTLNDEAQEFIWTTPQDALKLDIELITRKTIEKYTKTQHVK